MMNQDHRPKGRGMSNRAPSSRGNRSNHAHTAQALLEKYQTNDRFTHFICTLVGKRVNLEVKNGKLYNGVLTTVSPNFEFVLSKVHVVPEAESNAKVPPDANMIPRDGDLYEKIIFKTKDIVTVTCPAVELEECSKGETFQTDQAISHCVNGEVRERELQKWTPDELPQETPVLGTKSEKSNGWCAREMFKINEQRYGVTSDYDSDMTSYTTKLEKKDTEEYYEREKRAEKLAREIELNQHFEEAVDGGKTEEELYSAVVRQQKQDVMSHHSRGRPAPVMERKDKSVESSKIPSPHTNSPVSSRKLNGEDARQKPVDSEPTPKPEIKTRSPKERIERERDGKREFNHQQLKEKILNAKPVHIKIEERSQKANKSVDPKELYEFSRDFNLSTKPDEHKVIKKQMPETQDIRKLEECEKLRAEEAPASPNPMPTTSTPPAPESSAPLANEDNKSPSPANKPSAPETTQSSPATKSNLNPNAKEFRPTFKTANSKPSSPSQSQGVATPVQPTVQQPPGHVVPRVPYPHVRQQRPRGGYPIRSEYHEQSQYSSSSGSPIMAAGLAPGQPIMAHVFQPPQQYPNPVPFPNMPMQAPMVMYGQRFIPQVGYSMPISAQAPVMASGQGTMVTAGNYQTGSGSFQEGGPMPVYVSQPTNMSAAPQHPLPGQPQYPQHIIATTPTGPPPPHQSPQPHPQSIFFQQQPNTLQPPPNQPQTILQPGPGVAMPQPPPQLVVMQQPQNLPPSSYNR